MNLNSTTESSSTVAKPRDKKVKARFKRRGRGETRPTPDTNNAEIDDRMNEVEVTPDATIPVHTGFKAIVDSPSSFPEIRAPPYENPRREREWTSHYLIGPLAKTPMGIAYGGLVAAAHETRVELDAVEKMIKEFLEDPFDLGLLRFRYFAPACMKPEEKNSIEECERRREQHGHRLQTRKRQIISTLSDINQEMQWLEEEFMSGWTRLTR
jgi:hypothetical protein